VNSIEQVQVFLDLDHEKRGDLDIFLKSPSGSISMLLSRRPNDQSKNGFSNWYFTSVHFWGENPKGRWHLLIRDRDGSKGGIIRSASLLIYGTREIPRHLKKKRVYPDQRIVSVALDKQEEEEYYSSLGDTTASEENIYDQNSHPNYLSPVLDAGKLLNWNDYGYALIPLISDQQNHPHHSQFSQGNHEYKKRKESNENNSTSKESKEYFVQRKPDKMKRKNEK